MLKNTQLEALVGLETAEYSFFKLGGLFNKKNACCFSMSPYEIQLFMDFKKKIMYFFR